MPQTKFQSFIFGALMSFAMTYTMELFNNAYKMGAMSNSVFLTALSETSFMCLIVFTLSNLCGNRIGKALAFQYVTPGKDNPFFITIMISSCTVAFMCPAMSLIATVIFVGIDRQFIANWISTVFRNFPIALLLQLFFAGPLVRSLFRLLFKKQLSKYLSEGREQAIQEVV